MWLVIARGIQGLGVALAAPASLSIIMTLFAEGPARSRALGVSSAVATCGVASGLLLGGGVTQALGCSQQQNRNGQGFTDVDGAHVFAALYWCPVHGIEKVVEVLRS